MGANLKPTCIVIDDDNVYLVDNDESKYLAKDDGFREIPSENFKYLPKSMHDYDGKVMAVTLPVEVLEAIRDNNDAYDSPAVIYIRKGAVNFPEIPAPTIPPHPSGLNPNDYTGSSIEEKIVYYMLTNDNPVATIAPKLGYKKEYDLAVGVGELNIIYLKNSTQDFKPVVDSSDGWDDQRLLLTFDANKRPKISFIQVATIDPGRFYSKVRLLNPKGAFQLSLGQSSGWCRGLHKGYEALVQCRALPCFRDSNRDQERGGDSISVESGNGVNMHHGGNSSVIGRYSAGCSVGKSVDLHFKFMKMLKTDPRYKKSPGRTWDGTYLDLEWVMSGETSPVETWT